MKSCSLLFLALGLLLPGWTYGHEIEHRVSKADAVVVTIHYPDRRPFAFEKYEIYREGEKKPFQTGETDAGGRLAFLPDGEGEWLVKAFSRDGHGVEVRLSTDEASVVESVDRPLVDRYPRLFVGLGLLFGLFGISTLFFKRGR